MTERSDGRRVVIIGGGITGLTTAYRLLTHQHDPSSGTLDPRQPVDVTILESDEVLGGKIRTTDFVGLPIEEGPDAYLARVPHAARLIRDLGLEDDLTNPAAGHAAVWHNGLHPIPAGLLLGVPTGTLSLARSGLLSVRGKVRAALEPVLPSSGDHRDSIGMLIRGRFGREVHERLVDPLVGSIYAADTMNFSLEMVPQLADLAHERSILLAARKRLGAAPPSSSPVFETPRRGLSSVIEALRVQIEHLGGRILCGTRAETIESRSTHGAPTYTVATSGRHVDLLEAHAVIMCSPARTSAHLLRPLDSSIASALEQRVHASVVIVTAQVTVDDPDRFTGLSGYLVPKPDQDRVTAVSFGSNKWAHWKPDDGSMILRISLGRDGMPTDDLVHEWDDDRLLRQSIDEVARHIGVGVHPIASRVTRWPESFPQYRPGHGKRTEALEKSLAATAPGVFVAGASWHGIGLPACVADANRIAGVTGQYLREMYNL
jgi:protoporphyrinogen/coproporphyrinogen III oxidase